MTRKFPNYERDSASLLFYTATSVLSKRRRAKGAQTQKGSDVIPTRQVMAAVSRDHRYLSDSRRGLRSYIPRGHNFVGTVKKLWD